ncbi:YdcF family protein [Goodfellowiella coeruleoviolacea]|uniref:Protein SanA, affects membrane permeability for vancomycin n=1 Tax=Goodfellowiella coeruleoviolacea TaxID=334858 RepID=A0AAE3KG79_9PSEU|nr:YdcF family protein [Goodfellowiella coeruleoviolacea]MCP2165199.1 protein SanA, affects membrane permeability for vancomycin [Goodfellowiella coeruleoviolacea]
MPTVSADGMSPGRRILRALLRTVFGAVLIGVLVVGGTAFRVWQVARIDDRDHADMAVVLGAAQYNGVPSEVLKARLQHAKRLYETGVVSYVLTTGGRQAGDTYTEGESGRRWLVDNGVPAERVVPIGEGSDTLGTMRAVAEVAKNRKWTTAVIVSDPWHSLRARTMANDAGLTASVSPTRSGPVVQTRETQFNYIVRETGALLYYRLTRASAGNFNTNIG